MKLDLTLMDGRKDNGWALDGMGGTMEPATLAVAEILEIARIDRFQVSVMMAVTRNIC